MFFTMINDLRSLLKNKTSFGMDQLSKFWQFTSKSMFWNPTTFIENRGHHYDRGIEWNFMEPWNATHGRQDYAGKPRPLYAPLPRSTTGCSSPWSLTQPFRRIWASVAGACHRPSTEAARSTMAVTWFIEERDVSRERKWLWRESVRVTREKESGRGAGRCSFTRKNGGLAGNGRKK